MLHHGGNGDGGHYQDGCDIELAEVKGLQGNRGGGADPGKVKNGGAIGIGHAKGVESKSEEISDDDPHQDRNDLEHTPSPDLEEDDDKKGDNGQKPVGGRVADGGRGEA